MCYFSIDKNIHLIGLHIYVLPTYNLLTIYVVSMTTYVTMQSEAVPCLNITKSILKAVIFPAMSLLSLSVLPMNIVSVTHKQINMARSEEIMLVIVRLMPCQNKVTGPPSLKLEAL